MLAGFLIGAAIVLAVTAIFGWRLATRSSPDLPAAGGPRRRTPRS